MKANMKKSYNYPLINQDKYNLNSALYTEGSKNLLTLSCFCRPKTEAINTP